MPRSSGQSDFVVERTEPRVPRAIWVTAFASARSTKIVMWFVGITLALLVVLTLVGPHIPSGE